MRVGDIAPYICIGLIGTLWAYPAFGGVKGPVEDGSEVAVHEGEGVPKELSSSTK